MIARPRAVRCVAFFANSSAIGCKKTPCGLYRSALPPTREGGAGHPWEDAEGDPAASHFVIGPTRIYRNAVTGIQDGDGKWALRLSFGFDGGGTLRIPDTADDFVQQRDDEILVEWDEIVDDPPPYATNP